MEKLIGHQERILVIGFNMLGNTIISLLAEQLQSKVIFIAHNEYDSCDKEFQRPSYISRVITPQYHWYSFLSTARNLDLEIIVLSTERGCMKSTENLPLENEINLLFSFLAKRYQSFSGCNECGINVLLIAKKHDEISTLTSKLLDVANYYKMTISFIDWIKNCNEYTAITV